VRAHEVTFDVTEGANLGQACLVSGTVYFPDVVGPGPATVLFCVPGGTYTRSYWHLEVPGRSDYSFAADMVARGAIVVAIDNLGTGASSRPADGASLTHEVLSDALTAVVSELRRRLGQGILAPDLPQLTEIRLIGVGHSMGGMLVVAQQSRHRQFDAIVVLGSSFTGNSEVGGGGPDLETATQTLLHMAEENDNGYLIVSRKLLRSQFHLDDVPEDVLAADDALATWLPVTAGASAIASPLLGPSAATVSVPVFLAFGSRDMSPNPHAEVVCYSSSQDVTLFLVSPSAHCHNMSTGRQHLWERLAQWLTL
jgi:alpha-beta hydrolase superfamily lysophospholipase